jgi:hypothetical protein
MAGSELKAQRYTAEVSLNFTTFLGEKFYVWLQSSLCEVVISCWQGFQCYGALLW